MALLIYLPLILIIVIFIIQVFKRNFLVKHINKILFTVISAIIVSAIFSSVIQYFTWRNNPVSKFILPPHQEITYFLSYSGWKFFAPFVISFIAAALFYIIATLMNKKGRDRFFEKEEIIIASIALFLSGYPGVLVYFLLLVSLYLIVHIIFLAVRRRSDIIPLYYFWLPTAIFAIIIGNTWLSKLELWKLIKI